MMIEREPILMSEKLSSIPLDAKTNLIFKLLLNSQPVTPEQKIFLTNSGLFYAN
jgi:hypothetical protein